MWTSIVRVAALGAALLVAPSFARAQSAGVLPSVDEVQFTVRPECPGGLPCPWQETLATLRGTLPDGCWAVTAVDLLPKITDDLSPRTVRLTMAAVIEHCPQVPTSFSSSFVLERMSPGSYQLPVLVRILSRPGSNPPSPRDTVFSRSLSFKVGPPDALALSPVQPNPFDGRASFWLWTTREDNWDLEVYDLHGRRVAILYRGPLLGGRHDFAWDGGDESGARARGGLYFIRARTSAGEVARKAVLRRER